MYWQVQNHQFINFDDDLYVTENRHVISGLNLESLKWSFSLSEKQGTYWHPLTWISHMVDVQLWGLNADKHHLTNLFIHIMNVLLLFLVLRSMTGAVWRCAFVASVFALHPVNVDTVAWVAERKNLLSTFFWCLVMLTYLRYTRRPGLTRYLIVLVCFVMGLMAKPMLVTLPFVLILLDYWPLCRLRISQANPGGPIQNVSYGISTFTSFLKSPIIIDKIPLIIISFISIYIQVFSLHSVSNTISLEKIPLGLRISNALVSYVVYLKMALFPHIFAIYYPFPKVIPFWQPLGALIILFTVSTLVIRSWRARPYLVTGWFWYIGTLIPVIGLMQAGLWPAYADRWAYVPLVGIYIMVTWWFVELLNKSIADIKLRKITLSLSGLMILCILAFLTWEQTGHWKNSNTVFQHAVKVTKNNDIAHVNLSKALISNGDLDTAQKHCTEALRINPTFALAYINMGVIFKKKGLQNESIRYYKKAVQIDPTNWDTYNNLGSILIDLGRNSEAVEQLSKAIALNPECVSAYINMGVALYNQGQVNEAIDSYQKAIQIEAASLEARYNLAIALLSQGRKDEAINQLKYALRVNPENMKVQEAMSMLLSHKDN